MKAPYPTPALPDSVTAQIVNLANLPVAELKLQWQQLFGRAAPTQSRSLLERRIAYQLQENAYRHHAPHLLEQNQRRLASLIEHGKQRKRGEDYCPVAGTTLIREYQGKHYQVTATADGQYEFEGRRYPSLSRIAREITGTRWSGPLFFDLKAPAQPKQKGARQ